MPVTDYNPYSTVQPIIGSNLPGWIADKNEQLRIAAYDMYEQIFWTVPKAFTLVQRGSDDEPIYVPAARTIVETLHRFLAPGMEVICDPDFGSENERQVAQAFWDDLAKRERFYSVFNATKRMGIIRGDWVFHMRGDPEREEGSRVSIETIHPRDLFRIENEDGDTIGWHVITHIKRGDKPAIRRTTYRKTTELGGPSPITVEEAIFEPNAWGGPGQSEEKVLEEVSAPVQFPDPIDQLPIYHVPNFQDDTVQWGSSELRGLERIIAAVDQSISDEELELVLTGLGAYVTDMDKPLNAEGEEVDWDLGPGRVVKIQRGGKFERVTGTSSVAPHQEHLGYLHERMDEAAGQPAIAKGKVDVAVAESGVAQMIQMGPLLARTGEKEQVITDVISNYLFDLVKWVIAYEGGAWNFLVNIRWMPIYGDKLPLNREGRFEEILKMVGTTPVPVLPMNVAWDELRKLGYDLPENDEMWVMIQQQTKLINAAMVDGMAGRMEDEEQASRVQQELDEPDEDQETEEEDEAQ